MDCDDALFHRYDCNQSTMVRHFLGQKFVVVMRCANIVVAGNSYLVVHAKEAAASRVDVVPTVVDASRFAEYERASSRPVVIRWIGSGPVELLGVRCEVVEWTEAIQSELVVSLDIGIMPLPDSPRERGKCGYKLIQYMACGLPVVASSVGVNVDIVQPGENSFLAASAGEWEAALPTLATDGALRTRIGQVGWKAVEARYSLQVQAPRLDALLRPTAGAFR